MQYKSTSQRRNLPKREFFLGGGWEGSLRVFFQGGALGVNSGGNRLRGGGTGPNVVGQFLCSCKAFCKQVLA